MLPKTLCVLIYLSHVKLGRDLLQFFQAEAFNSRQECHNELNCLESHFHDRLLVDAGTRLKNALFFVCRAFHSYHWTDAFLFYMSALEALFSLDRRGGVTKTICRRVAHLLDDPTTWNETVIADLYNVRSRMTHGRLEARPDSEETLRLLDQLERLTKLCFCKLIQNNSLQHYATTAARDRFMTQLD